MSAALNQSEIFSTKGTSAGHKHRSKRQREGAADGLIGQLVNVPGSIFADRDPSEVLHGVVKGRDKAHPGCVVVKCQEDPRRFFFPISEVKAWLANKQPPTNDAPAPVAAGTFDLSNSANMGRDENSQSHSAANKPAAVNPGTARVAAMEQHEGDNESSGRQTRGSHADDGSVGHVAKKPRLPATAAAAKLAVADSPAPVDMAGDASLAVAPVAQAGGRSAAAGAHRRKHASKKRFTSKTEVADLLGQEVEVPAKIFGVEVPDMFYRGHVLAPDKSHGSAVIVKLEDDKTRYFFPAKDVRQWLSEARTRHQKGLQKDSATTGFRADAFAAEVLTHMSESATTGYVSAAGEVAGKSRAAAKKHGSSPLGGGAAAAAATPAAAAARAGGTAAKADMDDATSPAVLHAPPSHKRARPGSSRAATATGAAAAAGAAAAVPYEPPAAPAEAGLLGPAAFARSGLRPEQSLTGLELIANVASAVLQGQGLDIQNSGVLDSPGGAANEQLPPAEGQEVDAAANDTAGVDWDRGADTGSHTAGGADGDASAAMPPHAGPAKTAAAADCSGVAALVQQLAAAAAAAAAATGAARRALNAAGRAQALEPHAGARRTDSQGSSGPVPVDAGHAPGSSSHGAGTGAGRIPGSSTRNQAGNGHATSGSGHAAHGSMQGAADSSDVTAGSAADDAGGQNSRGGRQAQQATVLQQTALQATGSDRNTTAANGATASVDGSLALLRAAQGAPATVSQPPNMQGFAGNPSNPPAANAMQPQEHLQPTGVPGFTWRTVQTAAGDPVPKPERPQLLTKLRMQQKQQEEQKQAAATGLDIARASSVQRTITTTLAHGNGLPTISDITELQRVYNASEGWGQGLSVPEPNPVFRPSPAAKRSVKGTPKLPRVKNKPLAPPAAGPMTAAAKQAAGGYRIFTIGEGEIQYNFGDSECRVPTVTNQRQDSSNSGQQAVQALPLLQPLVLPINKLNPHQSANTPPAGSRGQLLGSGSSDEWQVIQPATATQQPLAFPVQLCQQQQQQQLQQQHRQQQLQEVRLQPELAAGSADEQPQQLVLQYGGESIPVLAMIPSPNGHIPVQGSIVLAQQSTGAPMVLMWPGAAASAAADAASNSAATAAPLVLQTAPAVVGSTGSTAPLQVLSAVPSAAAAAAAAAAAPATLISSLGPATIRGPLPVTSMSGAAPSPSSPLPSPTVLRPQPQPQPPAPAAAPAQAPIISEATRMLSPPLRVVTSSPGATPDAGRDTMHCSSPGDAADGGNEECILSVDDLVAQALAAFRPTSG